MGDYDHDGDEDLLVLNLMREGATLFANSGQGDFTDVSARTGWISIAMAIGISFSPMAQLLVGRASAHSPSMNGTYSCANRAAALSVFGPGPWRGWPFTARRPSAISTTMAIPTS